jgi:hypothetical protein
MVWLLFACIHTPPSPAWPEPVVVRTELRERMFDDDGRHCSWEEDSLWSGERRILGEEPPDAEDWCRSPMVHWRTIDIVGQDGPYLSLISEDSDGRRSCGTLNLTSGDPATLSGYDEKNAQRRARRAARLLRRHPAPGGFDPDRFLLRNGHVRFCWMDETGAQHDLDVP